MSGSGQTPEQSPEQAPLSDEERVAELSRGSMLGTVRRGAALSAVAFVLVQSVALVQVVVLARLLSPAEIGIYAAGTVLIGFVASFTAGGLGAALVQRRDRVDDATRTVFVAAAVGGVLATLVVLAAAPLLALVFRSDVVGLVAASTCGVLLLHSLTVVPDSLIKRHFNFVARLVVTPVIALSYAVVAITLAAQGFGVWSLVWAGYASHVCWLVASWALVSWRPRGAPGKASFSLWRELARFSLPLVVGGVVYRFREILETVIVGRRLGDDQLGQYRYGRRLCVLPGTAVVEIVSWVLLPAFARMATDAARFRAAYLRTLGWVWLATIPVTGMLIAIGEPLVVLALGDRWRDAGLALVAMSGFALGEALCGVSDEAVKASGSTRGINVNTAVGFVATVVLLLLLIDHGLVGVGIAISVANLLMGLSSVAFACRATGARLLGVLGRLLPATLLAAVALAVVWPLEHLVVHSDSRGVLLGLLAIAGQCLLYLLVFAVGVRLLQPALFGELSGEVRRLLRRRGE